MRDVETIIKNRNNLKEATRKIKIRVSEIKGNTKYWKEMSMENQIICDKLERLKIHYLNQMRALNFVLNEDDKLETYKYDTIFAGFDELFADLNVR